MKEQTVWRVQNEFGNGPFRGLGNILEPYLAIEKAGRISAANSRPVPWKDKGLKAKFNGVDYLNPRTICGFKDLEQYHSWFDTQELQDLLHYAGFFLAQYKVEGPVWHGETQSLFFGDKAKLVAVRACNDSNITTVNAMKLKAAQRFLKRKP